MMTVPWPTDAEAIGIYELCMRHFIRLEVEEIPRASMVRG